jgi:D-glycero-D-manno-heptose 1,7-bisphosphate phosphatase
LKSADKFNGWALFLDRDGVINDKLENDYVKDWSEFRFQTGVLNAIADLSCIFSRIFIVTNQRGVGLGLMTEKSLHEIHEKMISEIKNASGRID